MSESQIVTIYLNTLLQDNSIEKKIAKFRNIPFEPLAFNTFSINILDNYIHKKYSTLYICGEMDKTLKNTLITHLMDLGYLEINFLTKKDFIKMIKKSSLHIGGASDLKYSSGEFALVGNFFEYLYTLFHNKVTQVRYHFFGFFNFLSYISLLIPVSTLIKPRLNYALARPIIIGLMLSLGFGDLLRTLYELPLERTAFYNKKQPLCGSEFIYGQVPVKYALVFLTIILFLILYISFKKPMAFLPILIGGIAAFFTYLMPWLLRFLCRILLMVFISWIYL